MTEAYAEREPRRLLEGGLSAPETVDASWHVRWDRLGPSEGERLCRDLLPEQIDFSTSGTTGPSRTWRRLAHRVWDEAGMLAGFVADDVPGAVVSFVPPAHLFGALTSVLVPAHLGVPVWYRPAFVGAMPRVGRSRVVVMATPWIFQLLLQHLDWVRGFERITVLYGGAMLPATAGRFLREAGPRRARIVEVLGSTEAGGVGVRTWREGEPPPWNLFPDVEFAEKSTVDEVVPLVVRSPRLAFRPGEAPPPVWEADDRVTHLPDGRFLLVGRGGRLVKVNGRRINLDEAEYTLRSVLDCEDLALVPVHDERIGEHVELLLVPAAGTGVADLDLAAAFARLGVRPKKLHVVSRIERSALGKLRHDQVEVVTT
ncbi:AMP-binding protein [Amycolatopsis suaedae]|uniref:Long-chain fatty acid--CoA ligase n=1 Tax=Amycolatopsis suaedae TaxID=2510978 RepID=A0A4Q7J2N6_9PSEU|nr:class I adenylate-forming enzyme family protein [Amycolatopsis suaedae]RZQ61177.1 long-chain fatty acid--CoA ligase [Amycolatopsis suaedae]